MDDNKELLEESRQGEALGIDTKNKSCLIISSIDSPLKELSNKEFDFIYIDEVLNKSLSSIKKDFGIYTLINDYDIGFGKLFQKENN